MAAQLSLSLPVDDGVLRQTKELIESFNQYLPLLGKLSSPVFKQKHWRILFRGMELVYEPVSNMSVSDLLSKNLLEHQDFIIEIWQEGKAEFDMEQVFRKLQRRWEGEEFRLANFILTEFHKDLPPDRSKRPPSGKFRQPEWGRRSRDTGTFTIIGSEDLRTLIEDCVMTLSIMTSSPYISEFRQEVENWEQLLQQLEELLYLWERFQLKWVFLNRVFYEMEVGVEKSELLCRFKLVDESYKSLIEDIAYDPLVMSIVKQRLGTEARERVRGEELRAVLKEGLGTLEEISDHLGYLFDSPRAEFPRLYFLSDGELIQLLSAHVSPPSLLPLVRKCFPSVQELQLGSHTKHPQNRARLELYSVKFYVSGVCGRLGEKLTFNTLLESSIKPVNWLCDLEQKIRGTLYCLLIDCMMERRSPKEEKELETKNKFESNDPERLKKNWWDLAARFPMQCLLVSEEVLWCKEVRECLFRKAPINKSGLKSRYAAKLRGLIWSIRKHCAGYNGTESFRVMSTLRALVLLNIKHNDILARLSDQKTELESSFEWQRLVRYYMSPKNVSDSSDPVIFSSQEQRCYIDVLGFCMPYGYEYVGPDGWLFVNTPNTERAALGLLLALSSYGCSSLIGPSRTGKSETVAHLGKAFGQQVITMHCSKETSPSIVLRMLSGAIQTGAWLVLDAVDLMTQGALGCLGQHLLDIRHSLAALLKYQQNTDKFQSSLKTQTSLEAELQRDTGEDFFSALPSPNIYGLSVSRTASAEIVRAKPFEPPTLGDITFNGRPISAKLGYGCILIMSGLVSQIPENLQAATRPISLIQPDSRAIAEVSLVALGFTHAKALANKLITLFTLAQDTGCLPHSSGTWLPVLKKIIFSARSQFYKEDQVEGIKKNGRAETKKIKLDKPIGEKELEQQKVTSMKFSENQEPGKESHKSPSSSGCSKSENLLQTMEEEQAILKAIFSFLMSSMSDPLKLAQFSELLKEIFPAYNCCFPEILKAEQHAHSALLVSAVSQELWESGLHSDQRVIGNIIDLYHALQLTRAVILVGPAGSGKTTSYRALAGALRRLAASTEEMDCKEEASNKMDGLVSGRPTWTSVDTAIIFPSSLSMEEFIGVFQSQGSWLDGALTKILKDSEKGDSVTKDFKQKPMVSKEKWVVLDGGTLAEGWLDPISTLLDTENPFLSLPSGEQVRPSRETLKIVLEVTELDGASPSVITQCGLVYHTEKDVWRTIWKAAVEVLTQEYSLDKRTKSLWSTLADELFAPTLAFLKCSSCSPVLIEGTAAKQDKTVAYGMQEVTSFNRILRAFLEQCNSEKGTGKRLRLGHIANKGNEAQSLYLDDSSTQSSQHLLAINMFVVSYIWGFGGHLHPRSSWEGQCPLLLGGAGPCLSVSYKSFYS
ncbi:dynein heavy chain domain-containing protein 1 [Polyodon spathula]|uniref:dynein heavy chain domain-containing protein 1 n=1 Tax=Polyodon spathula TaxID=7913 RepID=UPI001B7DED1D|nr:dynein heavy chain domain-containing protein 1 [Polyodon spathula]